jgi:hypothetical protein
MPFTIGLQKIGTNGLEEKKFVLLHLQKETGLLIRNNVCYTGIVN